MNNELPSRRPDDIVYILPRGILIEERALGLLHPCPKPAKLYGTRYTSTKV